MFRFTIAKSAFAILLIFSISWNSWSSQTEIGFFGKLSTGGYLGSLQPAVGLDISPSWDVAIGLGRTPALHNIIIYQLNLETRYNLLADISDGKLVWRPLHVTAGLLWALNNDFFITSPSRYPEKTYYEPTSIAGFLGLGTEMKAAVMERSYLFALWASVTDRYLVAKFNNLGWDSAYCCSAGFSIKTNFK